MPEIDFEEVDMPRFMRPELLRHPTIPRPMSGLAPRVVMGQDWWDQVRRGAYAENNQRCWACGGPGPLEAHEAYDINHVTMRMKYVETVALCSDCHAFIHIGRTIGLFARGRVSINDARRIVQHGFRILRVAGLNCPWETRIIEKEGLPWNTLDRIWIANVLMHTDHKPIIPMSIWGDWRMEFNGELYPPVCKSSADYERKYKND